MNTINLKRYFWYFFGMMGVVFFWAGVWDGIGSLPYLVSPWISLAVGLVMLISAKKIFSGMVESPENKEVNSILQHVHHHPKKQEFNINYKDKLLKKETMIGAGKVKDIEKDFLIMMENKKEVFVPLHRITKITHKGKTHWKA